MTEYEFEILKQWIGDRSRILVEMRESSRDLPFVQARLRELEAVDEEAKAALVTDDDKPLHCPGCDGDHL